MKTRKAPKARVIQGWNANHPCTGANMVANLDGVILNYKEQLKADRRAAAAERRQAEIAADDARVKAMYQV